MQHQLSKGLLLDQFGNLNEAGYATSLVKTYDRQMIQTKGFRVKEWDYYYVGTNQFGIAFTIADNDYMWLSSVTFFDFIEKKEVTHTQMGWFPRGRLKLPKTSKEGDIYFKNNKQSFEFKVVNGKRHLDVTVVDFIKGTNLDAHLVLEPQIQDSMVIATPFLKPKHFYYNQKINLLKSSGSVVINHHAFDFNGGFGVLDWGRGVWTYKNTWYWASMSGSFDGQLIGFNLGYGFGDTSKATENMVFINDKTYKFNDIAFEIPMDKNKEDYLATWTIKSKNLDIDLTFKPILDRHSHTNIILIQSNQHQVFGHFSGKIKVSQTETIEFRDMIGFAEKVKNNW